MPTEQALTFVNNKVKNNKVCFKVASDAASCSVLDALSHAVCCCCHLRSGLGHVCC
jgi:hypothetical protein